MTFNGQPYRIGQNSPETSIDLTGKSLLEAYRIVSGNDTIYNLYNLLRGDDDWDPCHMKEQILSIEKSRQRNLSTLPVKMGITPTKKSIETGKGNIILTATTTRYGCKPAATSNLSWSLSSEDSAYVRITPSADGGSCAVESIHDRNEVREVAVQASNSDGLCAAAVVYARPRTLPAPDFIE